ncbi:ABC transporter transmembrane domain-containing protein [Mycolicibacterium neoaurum]|uniref:ABC transporter transmembrane domain-containing protein n=1 Tax=Mycolicibacterium neoaurum TaxID=1795 RepID=UPI001F4D197D|nr:ABC transporter ATP-binding protein [Mycolicibacterium neoaurum]
MISQWRRVLVGTGLISAYMVLLTVPPHLTSRAIDSLSDSGPTEFLSYTALLFGTGVLLAVLSALQYRIMTLACADASIRTLRVLTRAVIRLGPVLHRQVGAGELVVIGSADVQQIAAAVMLAGPGVAGVLGYCAIGVVLLGISPVLAAVVLIGVPLMAVLIAPLIGRLQRAEGAYRDHQGRLTARAGDVVAGLRVLCGIGGKRVFAERYRVDSRELRDRGYRVASVTSWIGALALALPVMFVAIVTWLAARLASDGAIGIGEMVAVYGYVAVLAIPVQAILYGIDDIGRYPVLARRLLNVLQLKESVPDAGTDGWPSGPCELYDLVSGVRVPCSSMVAVVAANREDVIALFDRLARFSDPAATLDGTTALATIRLAEVREHIMLVDNNAYIFAGSVGSIVAGYKDFDDGRTWNALRIAAAEDVVTRLPNGLRSILPDQATILSGGQRQRLRLARAIYAEPDILLLLEPTSAVDAHTETLIAARLHDARRQQTTVVATTSTILLERADKVIFLPGDGTVEHGSHRSLMANQAAYRAMLMRETIDDTPSLNDKKTTR